MYIKQLIRKAHDGNERTGRFVQSGKAARTAEEDDADSIPETQLTQQNKNFVAFGVDMCYNTVRKPSGGLI